MKMLWNFVLVEPIIPKDEIDIILKPETVAKEAPIKGRVEAFGADCKFVKKDDEVIYNANIYRPGIGAITIIDGKDYVVMREVDIYGVL